MPGSQAAPPTEPVPLILFGAFDRHNLGDLLFAHLAARQAGRAVVFAGLAERDLGPWGGHRLRAIGELAESWGEAPADLLHVGGEILTCSRFEAAVMLQPPAEASTAIRSFQRRPADGERWARRVLGVPQRLGYVVPRHLFRTPRHFVFHGVGGVGLDRLHPAVRDEALAALRAADRVCVRDAVTHAHLAAAGLAAELAPDPAALTARLFATEIADAAAGEVAALRSRHPQGYLAVQFSADYGDDATLDQLAAQLAEVQADSGLALVFFCAGRAPWHDDPAVYERLLARLPPGKPAAIFRSSHIWALCALLAHAAAYCGSSLHGRIVASAFARPCVSLGRDASGSGKSAAYAATWDSAPHAAPATPAHLAGALIQALRRPHAELALHAKDMAGRAAAALRASLDAA